MARPLTEVSNVYQNTMLVSTRDIEQVRNSIPEHPSQPDTDEWDAQTRNVTIRGPFSKSTCPSCSFIWKTLKPFGVHSKVTELCFRAESPAERAHCLAATLEGVVLYIARKGIENSSVQPLHSSQRINLAFMHDCMRHCEINYVSDCVSSKTIPNTTGTMSIYLIDVYTDSMVRKSTRMTYTALSYVWVVSLGCRGRVLVSVAFIA